MMLYNSKRFFLITLCIIFVIQIPLVEQISSSPPRIVLLTGFEPFGSHEINPSQLIVETLHGQHFDDVYIYGVVLPVDFERSKEITTQLIDSLHPIVVISMGLEAKADGMRVERFGINLVRDPFGTWEERRLQRITCTGPFVQASSLPAQYIVHDLRNAGIPARQSVFAGTYACNALLYQILDHIITNQYNIIAGFVHVPLLSSEDQKMGLDLDTLLDATQIVIQTSLSER